MKKSSRFFVITIVVQAIAVTSLFAGEPDVRTAAFLIVGFVCLAAAEILEALGK